MARTSLSRPPITTSAAAERRRRVERKLPVGIVEPPLHALRRDVDRDDLVGERAEVRDAGGNRRRRGGVRARGFRSSDLRAVGDANAVKDLVAAAEVRDAVPDRPASRARSSRSRPSTATCRSPRRARTDGRRTSRSARGRPTTTGDDLISAPVLNVQRALPVAASTACSDAREIADVHDPARHRRRRLADADVGRRGLVFPLDGARREVDRDEIAVVDADVDDAVRQSRPTTRRRAGLVRPEQAQRRRQRRRRDAGQRRACSGTAATSRRRLAVRRRADATRPASATGDASRASAHSLLA